jgi:hypothetical protein
MEVEMISWINYMIHGLLKVITNYHEILFMKSFMFFFPHFYINL